MWIKEYLLNASVILSIMYLSSFVHKKLLADAKDNVKSILFICASVFIGWSSMLFGIHLSDFVIFDLRFIPIIIATLFCRNALHVFIIALFIGLIRLTFGISEAAWVGFLNMIILGLTGIVLRSLLARFHDRVKVITTIIVMNVINMVVIAVWGVIPTGEYLSAIAPSVFPINILFSLLLLWMMKDLQHEFIYQMELRMIAAIDPLTQLHNRRAFMQYQTSLLAKPPDGDSKFAAAFMDIDHFKKINDTYGHITGDQVLQQVGMRISSWVRDQDFASRYGGEEFVVLFQDVKEEEMKVKFESFRKSFETKPIFVGEIEIPITLSIGVAFSPPFALHKLVDYADKALYRAKEKGRNNVQYFM